MTIDRMLENPDELKDLVLGYEPEIWGQLAVCMRYIRNAAMGGVYAKQAILSALSEIEKELIDCAEHKEEKTR
jgi:hypothetical protein